jgi:hypothetical protein
LSFQAVLSLHIAFDKRYYSHHIVPIPPVFFVICKKP